MATSSSHSDTSSHTCALSFKHKINLCINNRKIAASNKIISKAKQKIFKIKKTSTKRRKKKLREFKK